MQLTNREVDRHAEVVAIGAFPLPDAHLVARLLEHPVTELDDLADLLGQRDEGVRWNEPPCRMMPTQQGLDGRHVATAHLEDGLVVDLHLTPTERLLEVGTKLETLDRFVVHPLFEALETSLALALGGVHRDIRVAQKGLVATGLQVRHGDPDAGAAEDLTTLQGDRHVHGVHHPAGHLDGFLLIFPITEQESELVASEPRHQVTLDDAAGQPCSNLLEQSVPRLVTETIVDRLEVVQVDEEHAHERTLGSFIEQVLQALRQHRAVGESGESIVQRVVRRLFVTRLDGVEEQPDSTEHEEEQGDRGAGCDHLVDQGGCAPQEIDHRHVDGQDRQHHQSTGRQPSRSLGDGLDRFSHRRVQRRRGEEHVEEHPEGIDERSGREGSRKRRDQVPDVGDEQEADTADHQEERRPPQADDQGEARQNGQEGDIHDRIGEGGHPCGDRDRVVGDVGIHHEHPQNGKDRHGGDGRIDEARHVTSGGVGANQDHEPGDDQGVHGEVEGVGKRGERRDIKDVLQDVVQDVGNQERGEAGGKEVPGPNLRGTVFPDAHHHRDHRGETESVVEDQFGDGGGRQKEVGRCKRKARCDVKRGDPAAHDPLIVTLCGQLSLWPDLCLSGNSVALEAPRRT